MDTVQTQTQLDIRSHTLGEQLYGLQICCLTIAIITEDGLLCIE